MNKSLWERNHKVLPLLWDGYRRNPAATFLKVLTNFRQKLDPAPPLSMLKFNTSLATLLFLLLAHRKRGMWIVSGWILPPPPGYLGFIAEHSRASRSQTELIDINNISLRIPLPSQSRPFKRNPLKLLTRRRSWRWALPTVHISQHPFGGLFLVRLHKLKAALPCAHYPVHSATM